MNPEADKGQIKRRQFRTRLAKAAGIILAGGGVTVVFHDRKGPMREAPDLTDIRLPDFSVAHQGPKMAISRGAERKATLGLALKAIGGIEAFIKPGDRVLLKVNAAFAAPPLLSATTHPDLVSELSRLCLGAGAQSVWVTDNPINDPQSCFTLTGIAEAARTAGATVVVPQAQHFKSYSLPNGRLIKNWPLLYAPLKKIDKIIGAAPVKDHHRSGASLTMKNWYGLLGGRRNIFHQDINNIIKELAMMVQPTLVVLDGTRAMMKNGPTGGALSDLKPTETMIVGTDQVAVDAFGATLLGRTPGELTYISKAAAEGVGTADWRSLNPVMTEAG
jgi:uncharacterized protein (DUF362 family)